MVPDAPEVEKAALGPGGIIEGILGEVLPKKAFRGDFEPGFFTRLSMKDQRLALDWLKRQVLMRPPAAAFSKRCAQPASKATRPGISPACFWSAKPKQARFVPAEDAK